MNSNVIRSLALAAVLTGVACAPPPPPRERVVVYEQPAPPPPVTEVVVAQPGPEYVWVRGHHRWDEGAHAYVWVSGRWVVPPTGFMRGTRGIGNAAITRTCGSKGAGPNRVGPTASRAAGVV